MQRSEFRSFAIITASDSENISVGRIRGILLSKSTDVFANVAIHNEAGAAVTLTGLKCGEIHPISTTRILATATTATTITVFW